MNGVLIPSALVAVDCPLTDQDLNEIRAVRRQMLGLGFLPLAVHAPWSLACAKEVAGKAPMGTNWQNGHPIWRLCGKHPGWSRAGSNSGVLLGVGDTPIQALDLDINGAPAMNAALAAIKPIVPRGSIVRFRGNSARLAMLLRCEPGVFKEKLQGEHGTVERLASGQQLVVHGTHPSGAALAWYKQQSPWAVSAASLPLMDEASVGAMFAAITACGALGGKLDRTSASASRPHAMGPRGEIAQAFKACLGRSGGVVPGVREFLRETGARGTYRHDTLVSVAGSLIQFGWPHEQAAKLLTDNADAWFGEGSWAKEVDGALAHALGRRSAPRRSEVQSTLQPRDHRP